MIKYACVGSNDLERAKKFYDALLGSIGMRTYYETSRGGRMYGHPQTGLFSIAVPYNGEPATIGNGTMAGFCLDSPDEVSAFHAKALSLGAADEGHPGPRGTLEPAAFFAYFRDPDGNKLCAYWIPDTQY